VRQYFALERPERTSRWQRLEPLLVNEQAEGVAAGDFPCAVDLAIVLMDVAVAVEDAIPGLHEIVNAQVLFALSGQ
jgi:hypothetical protein